MKNYPEWKELKFEQVRLTTGVRVYSLVTTGLAQAWEELEYGGLYWKVLKIKFALKSSGKLLFGLDSSWNLLFSVRTFTEH